MRQAFWIVFLFAGSTVAIAVGYSYSGMLFDAAHLRRMFHELPMIRGAAWMTANSLIAMAIARLVCKNVREVYNAAALGYSLLSPGIMMMIVLPGADSVPGWAPNDMMSMFVLLTGSQAVAVHHLRHWFWKLTSPRDLW